MPTGYPKREQIVYEHPKHGYFPATPYQVDKAIRKHLPASPLGLRNIVELQTNLDYSDVHEVAAFLVILASFESEL